MSNSPSPALPAASGALVAPVLLVSVGTFLALSIICARLAAGQGAPMLWFIVAVMGWAGVVLLATSAAGGGLGGAGRYVPYAVGAGGLFALANAMGYLSVARVGAGYVALTFAFPVLFTWVIALALRMERVRPARLIGVIAGVAGGVVLAAAKLGETGPEAAGAGWVILASGVPVVLAVGNIYRTRFWPRGARPLPLAGLTLVAGAVVTAPFALALHGGPGGMWSLGSGTALILAAAVAVVAAQNALQFKLQLLAGPVYMSQIGSVAAIVGALVAVTVLGEALPARFALAAVLIAFGVAAFTLAQRRA